MENRAGQATCSYLGLHVISTFMGLCLFVFNESTVLGDQTENNDFFRKIQPIMLNFNPRVPSKRARNANYGNIFMCSYTFGNNGNSHNCMCGDCFIDCFVKTHEISLFKYVLFTVFQLYFNKLVKVISVAINLVLL